MGVAISWGWIWPAATMLALALVPAQAAERTPQITIIGMGAGMPCSEWLAGASQEEAVEQWAFGYTSALATVAQAQTGADPLAAYDRSAIHAWLGTYCRSRTDDALTVALVQMIFAAVR